MIHCDCCGRHDDPANNVNVTMGLYPGIVGFHYQPVDGWPNDKLELCEACRKYALQALVDAWKALPRKEPDGSTHRMDVPGGEEVPGPEAAR